MEALISKSPTPLTKSFLSKALTDSNNTKDLEPSVIDHESEASEIASQLSSLRKRHDKLKESNTKKRLYCEKLKSELDTFELSSNVFDSETKSIQSKLDQIHQSLEETQKKSELEKLNKKSYLHVFERMKQEKLALEIKANSLQEVLKESKMVLELETDKFRRIRESQHNSKQVIQGIKQAMLIEQKRKQEQISQLEKTVKDQQELAFRREERKKRQFEVLEAAANDDKDSQEAKIRELYLLNRLWTKYTKLKLDKEVTKGTEIDHAFHKIKHATGVFDNVEIVDRFLLQNGNYLGVVTAVKEAEVKLDMLKKYNLKARERLERVQLTENGSSRKLYSEIEETEGKLAECYKEAAGIREKLKKAVLGYDRVLNWGNRMVDVLEIETQVQVSDGSSALMSTHTLYELFLVIYEKLEKLIQKFSNKKPQNDIALEKFAKRTTFDIISQISSETGMVKTIKRRLDKNEKHKTSDSHLPKLRDKSTERIIYNP